METPLYNLIIFLIVSAFALILFWPRLGFIQAVRGRLRISKRTQLEDALKFIHNSSHNNEVVSVDTLSNSLNLTESKTAELTEHMKRVGLVDIVDGRIQLTVEGEQYALQIIRAHRLWERYLADETSVDPKDWHTKAEEYEHKITREEVDSLADKLGNPLYDPHGDPIPSADGEYQDQPLVTLTDLNEGDCARVMHLEDEPESVYDQLVALGIYLGMELCFKGKSGENYQIETEDKILQVTPEAALNLSVLQIDKIEKPVDLEKRETLDKLEIGESAKIVQISPMCRGYERRRLMDLGIVPSTEIEFYKHGLTGGLRAYGVRGTVLALRDEQIKMISITERKRAQ